MVGRCSGKWKNYFDMTYYYNRGIRVCEEWEKDFDSFKKWSLSNGYDDNLSIDRINPDGNYEPSNCRWIPININKGLARKKPRVHTNYYGEKISIVELSKKTGIPYATLMQRIKKGMSSEDAVKKGTKVERKIFNRMTINERIKYIREDIGLSQSKFAESIGVGQTTVSYMEKNGSKVTEQNLRFICKLYNINYFWLTEEKGEIYLSPPKVIANEVAEKYNLDEKDIALIEEYVNLDPDVRKAIKQLIINVVKKAPDD